MGNLQNLLGGTVMILSILTFVINTLAVAGLIVGGTVIYHWVIHTVYGHPSMDYDRPIKKTPSPLERSIREIAEYMKHSHKKIYWSDVYYAMRQQQIVGSISAQAFGYIKKNNGGPCESVVRRSGDYNLSGNELNKRSDIIESISAYL